MYSKVKPLPLFYLSIFILSGSLTAQDSGIKIIDRLLASQGVVPQITTINLSDIKHPFAGIYSGNRKYLVKTASDLFLGVEGTGLLFRINGKGDSLSYERIDHTIYAGSNFFAAYFTLDDKIFNYGGYGFWKTNGSLRVFNKSTREWDIVTQSEEKENYFSTKSSGVYWRDDISIPTSEELKSISSYPSLFWIDRYGYKLITLVQRTINETKTTPNLFIPQICELDIHTGVWKELGRLKRYGWNNYVSVPWGLLVNESGSQAYLAEIKNNRIMMPDSLLLSDLSKLYAGAEPDILFAIDSTIYFGNIKSNTLDSINLSLDRFQYSGLHLYEEGKKSVMRGRCEWIYLIVLPAIFLLLRLVWLKKKKKIAVTPLDKVIHEIQETDIDASREVFSEVEKGLIQLLYEKSLKVSTASVEDLNKVLGVSAKPEAIKRKVRSEVLKTINIKWNLLTGSNDKLILFSRTSLDKRSREYFIRNKVLSNPVIDQIINPR